MIDVKKAWSVVAANNPGMKPFTCNEGENNYMFSLVPKDLPENDFYATGAVYLVDKNSGKYKIVPWNVANQEKLVKILDVSIFN